MTEVKEVPQFDELWDKGLDIIRSWNEIKEAIYLYLQRKAEELERQANHLRRRTAT